MKSSISASICAPPMALAACWALSTAAASLTPEDAAGHIGETATFCGVVASAEYETTEPSQPTWLDFGRPHPNAVFTVIILGDDRLKFGMPETSLPGKRICVTGQIGNSHGNPEIVLTEPSQ